MRRPEIALSLTTYQKPSHLRRVLASIAMQQGVEGLVELVVTDDGSTDGTRGIVEEFAKTVNFPVAFTTHAHGSFHPARCRNEGVAATSAPYVLFLDGDCILPPDHVAVHLARRQPNVALLGDCYRLEQEVSEKITVETILRGKYFATETKRERRRHRAAHRKAWLYGMLGSITKPKLVGNNFGVWRDDYLRVNGFDENYVGWGCEDDDLGVRLRMAGVRLKSILNHTRTFHLWHPRDITAADTWKGGPNIPYFLRGGKLSCCRNGVVKRRLNELAVRIHHSDVAESLNVEVQKQFGRLLPAERPELEVVLLPGEGRFSGEAECNVLVVAQDCAEARRHARHADVVIADPTVRLSAQRLFPLSQLDKALHAAA